MALLIVKVADPWAIQMMKQKCSTSVYEAKQRHTHTRPCSCYCRLAGPTVCIHRAACRTSSLRPPLYVLCKQQTCIKRLRLCLWGERWDGPGDKVESLTDKHIWIHNTLLFFMLFSIKSSSCGAEYGCQRANISWELVHFRFLGFALMMYSVHIFFLLRVPPSFWCIFIYGTGHWPYIQIFLKQDNSRV